ncbi:hypothetical protein PENTCL1PPCAC_29533, partial [Pristionchus entomophagus]
SLLVGIAFSLLSVIGFLVNCIVLYAISKGRLLYKGVSQSSSVYILSASSIAMDNLMIAVHVVYLIPAVFMQGCQSVSCFQTWLFSGGMRDPAVVFFSSFFLYCWYYTTLSHILISLTRLYAIVNWKGSALTNRKTVALVILVQVMSLGGPVLTQFVSPCCKISFDYLIYTYTYDVIEGVHNYSNDVVDVPFEVLSSVCSFVCYTIIIIYMRWMARIGAREIASKRRHQEYVFAMQFAAMATFYTVSWISFRVIPPLVGNSTEKWPHAITTSFVLLNSFSNAFVYLVNNAEAS